MKETRTSKIEFRTLPSIKDRFKAITGKNMSKKLEELVIEFIERRENGK